jgi:hypothetical protein
MLGGNRPLPPEKDYEPKQEEEKDGTDVWSVGCMEHSVRLFPR